VRALPAGCGRDAVGPFAALAGGLLVDLPGEVAEELVVDDLLVEGGIFAAAELARIVDEELALRNARRAEGVGFNNVGAGFEEPAMDIADHLRLREREEVAVVQQVLVRVAKALAADVGFLHSVRADGRAHRAVDDGDALFENGAQRMLADHVFSGRLRERRTPGRTRGWRSVSLMVTNRRPILE
jgi:hypothetical protein